MPDQSTDDKSIPTLATELWELVRAYVKQETLAPLKGVSTFLKFGVPGALLLGIGVLLLSMALLRALQTETGDLFGANLSFVPYLITLVVCGVVVGLAGMGMRKRGSRT